MSRTCFRVTPDPRVALRILTGKKKPSNETPALTKSTNMGIWVAGTTNQLFIRGS